MSKAFLLLSALVVLAAPLNGCARGAGPKEADAGRDETSRALVLVAPSATLPPRPEALALAQAVEARALGEGAGARAVELHVLAASLVERVFRLERREQDAREAVDLYRAAGKDLALAGACEASLRAAKLAGEQAHDAQTTYAEVYRVWRRGSASGAVPCEDKAHRVLLSLDAFRPAPPVLDAIDQGLAGEGILLTRVGDAGSVTLAGMGSRVAVAPRIDRVEHWVGPEAARVVVHLDRPARFRVGDVGSKAGRGARTFVELDGVDATGAAREATLGGIVSRIVAEPSTTGSRVAMDLDGPAYRRVFHLLEPFRIVIDIARQPPGAGGKGKERALARIAIDPGHGGNDPGASGPSGLKEKDVTLAIAHKLAPLLSRSGLEVTLTRDDDRYVTLEERTARANAFGADLFLSIHCNAAEKSGRKGIETYVLDTTTSDMAGRVAARENGASQAASAEVAQLLASMRLADQSTRSTKLADLLQRSAVASLATKYDDVVDGGVHKAGFYVLVGARMPAVLFEASYISNATEEQRLGEGDYQQRLADAMANAVKAYREGR